MIRTYVNDAVAHLREVVLFRGRLVDIVDEAVGRVGRGFIVEPTKEGVALVGANQLGPLDRCPEETVHKDGEDACCRLHCFRAGEERDNER